MRLKRSATALLITICLLLQACGGNFAGQLRLILAASGPLIQSLPLSEKLKSGLIVDFTDLANGAVALKTDLDACSDKPCKLNAVDRYEALFERVEARGHFGAHERLQQVESILRAIIESARIYYGAPAPIRTARVGSVPVTDKDAEKTLKAKIAELKAAMQP